MTPSTASIPFDNLSEASGIPISDEAAEMMVTRYAFAAELARGRRTLEIACASGPGVGMLAARSAGVVGADINMAMLQRARRHYAPSLPFIQASAEQLPFATGSFGCVLLLEASYYVPDMEAALREMTRVLEPGGVLLFVNANPERPDFIRSPYSHHYHSAEEFRVLLERHGYVVETRAAFPLAPPGSGAASALIGFAKSSARKLLQGLGLVPKTLRGRARLKRLLGRRLREMPGEIDESFAKVSQISAPLRGEVRDYMVIYVTATKSAPATSHSA